MKISVLLFFVGIALGVAGMLVIRPSASEEDLLLHLAQPVDDGDGNDREEFNEIASAIIFARLCELNDVRSSAIEKLSKIDPDQASTWVATQPTSSSRDYEINQVASELMEQGPWKRVGSGQRPTATRSCLGSGGRRIRRLGRRVSAEVVPSWCPGTRKPA